MKVFVYPEKTREELGAIRWAISWEEITRAGELKHAKGEDIDFDADLRNRYCAWPTEQEAREQALKVLESGKPFFGAVTLQKQVVDWFVQADRVAEWTDVGQPEEIA